MMLQRILVALVAIPLLLFSVFEQYTGKGLFLGIIALCTIFSAEEFFRMAGARVSAWGRISGIFFSVLAVVLAFTAVHLGDSLAAQLRIAALFLVGAFFLCFLTLVFEQIYRSRFNDALERLTIPLFAVVYVGFGFSSLVLLLQVPGIGEYLLLYAFVVVWMTDSFALFVGKLLGRHKLGLSASPHKTLEGSIGGTLFAVLFAVLLKLAFPEFFKSLVIFSWPVYILMTVMLSLVAQVGDLLESVIKRAAGTKDSSALVPGHGGLLDVFDAQIFMTPFFYLLVAFAGGGF
jgi:phosphatidate cytidylyltransferase